MGTIQFTIHDRAGTPETLELPDDINLSLMEVLKASGYPVAATCGGIALCATCHVETLSGAEALPPPGDAELDMLDTLPNASACSRLACQIRLNAALQGTVFALKDGPSA